MTMLKKMAFSIVTLFLGASIALGQTATSKKPASTSAAKPATASTAARGGAKPWQQIKAPPLPPFHPQQPKRIQLANGMVIFLQEDHELPLIDGELRIRGGARDVPAAKTGLDDVYGDVWRTGGTKSKTGDELDDFLEAHAAKVETGASVDSTSIGFNCLKQDFNDVFAIFMDLLQNPEFRQDKVDLSKQQISTGISRRNEDPSGIARREASKVVYGADNPYIRVPEYWTVAAVNRDDLLAFHRQYVTASNMILGVVGDFDSAQMEAKLRQAFDSLPKGTREERPNLEFKPPKPGVYLVDKEDVNQSNIRVVGLGIRRDNPDYYAAQVMNEILSGGFASRMFSNIRSVKGLAYSVGGGLFANFDYPGMVSAVVGTKSETTAKAIDALYEELNNLKTKPPTAVELEKAKANILNSFVFRFDAKEKILQEEMNYEFYGYPLDTLDKYRSSVEKVTLADVNRVVDKYIHPKELSVVVVGKSADFDRKLDEFGPVHKVDISIPTEAPSGSGAAAAPAGPTASNPEGLKVIDRVVNAMGGKDKVAGVKSIETKSNIALTTPQGEFTLSSVDTYIYPDSSLQVMSTPMGEMRNVTSPKAAFMARGGQTMDMPAAQKDETLRGLKRDPISVAQHAGDAKYFFAANGKDGANDVLDINADGVVFRWVVDAEGHLVSSQYHTVGQAGPIDRVITFSDYRPTDGLNLSYKREVVDNGKPYLKVEIQGIQLNPTVDAKAFDKP